MAGHLEDALQIERAQAGDVRSVASLFEVHRARLRRMIDLRMDPRIRSRVDASDVLQESFVELSRRLPEFVESDQPSFFLWLRMIAYGRLTKAHRRHLGARMRAADREVSLNSSRSDDASSDLLASQLAGQFTSVHRNLVREELESVVRETLDAMDPHDREILALRHFEELSTEETAALLGLSRSGVLKRYTRALRRLSMALKQSAGQEWLER